MTFDVHMLARKMVSLINKSTDWSTNFLKTVHLMNKVTQNEPAIMNYYDVVECIEIFYYSQEWVCPFALISIIMDGRDTLLVAHRVFLGCFFFGTCHPRSR